MRGKYVIFETPDGLEYPVLIPNLFVKHSEIAGGNFRDKPVAAGFFVINWDGEAWEVFSSGQSISLGLGNRPQDSEIIFKQFFPE